MGKTWPNAAPLLALVLSFFLISAAEAKPQVSIHLTRAGGGEWVAEISTSKPVYALMLVNSRNDWRRRSWQVQSDGILLDRRNGKDVIFARGAKPFKTVRLKISPYYGKLQAEYQPFIAFSDGAQAIHTGQFDIAVIPGPKVADRMPKQLASFSVELAETDIFFADDTGSKFFIQGVWNRGGGRWSSSQPATYVYAGQGMTETSRAMSAVIDPGLSPWLRQELSSFSAQLVQYYSNRLGVKLPAAPTALVAYGGQDKRGYSMRGSVLPGLVMLQMAGTSLSNGEVPEVRAQVRWFFAHEFAHFWNAQMVGMRTMDTAWIHEGGADAKAIRAMEALAPAGFDALAAFQERLDECIAKTSGKALNRSLQRGAFDDFYSCGAVLHLIAENAMSQRAPGADVMDFWRSLIRTAHARDGIVDERLWLETLSATSGQPALAETLKPFLHHGVSNPSRLFGKAFVMAGVPHHRDRMGRLVLEPPGEKLFAGR